MSHHDNDPAITMATLEAVAMTKPMVKSRSKGNIHNNHHPFVYVRCPQNAWVPARVVSTIAGSTGIPETAVVQLLPWHSHGGCSIGSCSSGASSDNGAESRDCDCAEQPQQPQQQTVALDDYPHRSLPLQNLQGSDGTLRVVADLVDLPFLHEVRGKKSRCAMYAFTLRAMFSLWYQQTMSILTLASLAYLHSKAGHFVQCQGSSRGALAVHAHGSRDHCHQSLSMDSQLVHGLSTSLVRSHARVSKSRGNGRGDDSIGTARVRSGGAVVSRFVP
jgi:hypothetical protein